VIPVEVTQTPWHYTTFWDWLDHWQSLAAGGVALIAALVAVFGAEVFARCKEQREIEALRAALASEVRLYVGFLISARQILTRSKEAFRKGEQQQRDFRDLAVLQPPVVYPAVVDRLGLMGRPRAGDVVDFYATIERLNFTAKAMSNEPAENVSMVNYLVIIDLTEEASRTSLRLLSEFPFDERHAEFRALIAKWDADRTLEH
jgi:hypothetical protein